MRFLQGRTIQVVIGLLLIIGFSGCGCNIYEEGKLILLSGRFGYSVEGPYGFSGTITKESLDMKEWNFSGKFVFTNPLYIYLGKTVSISESYPEQIVVKFYVIPCKLGDIFFQKSKEVPVQFNIPASNDARFRVLFY